MDADGRSYKPLPIKDPTLSVACAGGAWSPDDAPRWSPDGRKVVFAANSATASNIYVANADGTGLVQVTHDGHSDSPSWGTRPLSS